MQLLSVLAVVLTIAALDLLFRASEKIEEENRMIEAGIQTSRVYNEALQKKISEIRKFRHDAVGLLQAIDMLETGPDGKDAAESGSSLKPEAAASGTAMPLLEAVIELKRRQCAEEGIQFDCPEDFSALAGSTRDTDETDLCLLLQNLLDNAYEANLRIEDRTQRMMKLAISDGGAAAVRPDITIEVTNRIAEGEKVTFLTQKSRPELHGIGLRIVDDILRKYGGSRSVSIDNAQHILTTSIHMTPGRKEAD